MMNTDFMCRLQSSLALRTIITVRPPSESFGSPPRVSDRVAEDRIRCRLEMHASIGAHREPSVEEAASAVEGEASIMVTRPSA